MTYKTYTKIEVRVGGNVVFVVYNQTLPIARTAIRNWLDNNKHSYVGITAYVGDKAVKISGVRSTFYKKFPVATATIG